MSHTAVAYRSLYRVDNDALIARTYFTIYDFEDWTVTNRKILDWYRTVISEAFAVDPDDVSTFEPIDPDGDDLLQVGAYYSAPFYYYGQIVARIDFLPFRGEPIPHKRIEYDDNNVIHPASSEDTSHAEVKVAG